MFLSGTLVLVLLLLTSALTAQTTPGSASISYPTDNPTFNYIDRVDVTYTTPWSQGVNLSVYCQETASAPESPFSYQTYFNPLHESGTYRIDYIGNPNDILILQFPTPCWLKIQNVAGHHESALGGSFTMASTAGPRKTWGLDVAALMPTAPVSLTGSGLSTMPTTTSASTPASASPLPPQSGLTAGAKAGVGAAVGALALVVVVLAIFIYRLWRKLADVEAKLARYLAIDTERRYVETVQSPFRRVELPTSVVDVRRVHEVGGGAVGRVEDEGGRAEGAEA